ncbi:MAG: N-formylglutamate amidohydrolase, partial [Pseudomonadota bacterium]
ERRLERCHRPYHRAVASAIDAIEGEGALPVLVSIHSFTPQLRGRSLRPWHLALLWDQDDRLLRPLVEALMAEPEVGGEPLCIGDNEPYTGALAGDCMNQHGTRRGLPHILIEVRNDLIAVPEGQAAWGGRLARAVQVAVGQMVV